jgi:hypothetical protein
MGNATAAAWQTCDRHVTLRDRSSSGGESGIMFLGHYAVAFAAKRVAPRASLGTLFFATSFLDLIWPPLLLLGLERVEIAPGDTAFTPLAFVHYPISHSLLVVTAWSLLIGMAYYALRRSERAALVVGGLVASHWFLDALVHRPDLPLAPGTAERVGLGIWNSPAATIAIELGLFALGVVIYARTTDPARPAGRWRLVALIAVLALIFLGNAFGSPPPNWRAVAIAGLGLWLFVAWAHWADRARAVRTAGGPGSGAGIQPVGPGAQAS